MFDVPDSLSTACAVVDAMTQALPEVEGAATELDWHYIRGVPIAIEWNQPGWRFARLLHAEVDDLRHPSSVLSKANEAEVLATAAYQASRQHRSGASRKRLAQAIQVRDAAAERLVAHLQPVVQRLNEEANAFASLLAEQQAAKELIPLAPRRSAASWLS